MRRGRVLAGALVVAYLIATTLVLGYFGVGGFRAGWAWAVSPLAVGGAVSTWLAVGDAPRRSVWALAVAVLGVVIGARLVDVAPPSKGRLVEILDGLELPFFRVTAEQRSGHSTCRPHCPVVTRQYDAPTAVENGALVTVVTALSADGLIDEDEANRIAGDNRGSRFAVSTDRVRYEVRTRRARSGHIAVTVTARARRG